ncbi:MAG: beta-N-acetylhexosaminidase [Gemmatimonadaceae bacterium]|nr:beta-N-acetylhexosaminidase [Gemmatimonadaceae bacterium]
MYSTMYSILTVRVSRVVSFALAVCSAQLATTATLSAQSVMPRPIRQETRTGQYLLTGRTVIHTAPAFRRVATRFVRDIADPTGFDLTIANASGAAASGGIHLRRVAGLPREGYKLDVTSARIDIQASDSAGAFYALETVKQLLPPAIYRTAPVAGTTWSVPAVSIEDAPRFPWRGAHLDVARHFSSKGFVKKYIDLLARHKLNRFHWHLTDDQGWRIAIAQYPKLTEMGSCREQTMVGPYQSDPAKRVFDGKRHCGFYTQDDIREVVAYAADRMVTVVPEIEMPGHVQSVIHAYPELSSRPDSAPGVLQIWGVSPFILNPTDASVQFMQNVLREVLTLFPSPWIHVGGDEATKEQWKNNPQIQERIRSLGLKDEHEMQSWFIKQMDTFLTAQNRRLIGWDEILEGGLAPNATVMSWRGMAGGIAAAKSGHDVVMAPGSHTYFDHYQSRDKAREPLAFGGFTPLDSAYAFEPVPPSLTPEEAKHVLGAQAQVWTEYIPNSRQVEYMAYPRLVALSEVLWSPRAARDFSDFRTRLVPHLARLDALDVNYRPLDR